MSSILEALKELESDKARAAKKTTSVADVPSTPPRSLTPYIVMGSGLAIGVAVLGIYVWSAGRGSEQPAPPAAPQVARREASEPAPAPARSPDWLTRAEPPRARVAPPPSPPPAPAGAAPAPSERAAAPSVTERAAAAPPIERAAPTRTMPAPPAAAAPPAAPVAAPAVRPAPIEAAPVETAAPAPPPKPAPARAARGGVQQVQMEALAFSSHVHQRTVTLLVNGTRATLHQGESLDGVEVQLIMADGAYLQRGADVFFIGKPR